MIEVLKEINPLPPLLKWAGGKRQLANWILPHFAVSGGKYYEPFVGGAAVFLASKFSSAQLSDLNEELINFYTHVRDHPSDLISAMQLLENSESAYYRERLKGLKGNGVIEAARFIYLTTLSFNGIYRQNLKGIFNVPYGQRDRKQWFDEDAVWKVSKKLIGVRLLCADFEAAVHSARAGDCVYLDPPYTVAHSNNGFVKYNAKIFSWDDQVRLAMVANRLADIGCKVVVSNADHDSIRCLYGSFTEKIIRRSSVIAASANARKGITESLFIS